MPLHPDQLLGQSILSVPEAARALRVNPARVRALISAGLLDAAKVGGRWVVSAQSVERRKEAAVQPGRLLSARRAWGLLLLASGERPGWLSSSEVSRLRRRLEEQTIEALAPRLRHRAVALGLRAHPSDLARIRDQWMIVRTGISAAARHDVDLASPDDVLDAYAPARLVPRLKRAYALQASTRPNLILRAVAAEWPFAHDLTFAPAVVVGLDLFESDDPRLRRAGQALLRRSR